MRGVVSAAMTAALERLGLTPCFDLVVGASAGAINGAALLAGGAHAARPPTAGRSRRARSSSRCGCSARARDRRRAVLDLAAGSTRPGTSASSPARSRCTASRSASTRRQPTPSPGCARRTSCGRRCSPRRRMPWAGGAPVEIGGRRYLDGGLAAPIPVAEALAAGATHVLALQTRPHGVPRRSASRIGDRLIERHLRRLNPALVALYRGGSPPTSARRGHRAPLAPRRRARRTCSASGRRPGRRASASSSGAARCSPRRRPTPSAWSSGAQHRHLAAGRARSLSYSLVGLCSMPSLKRRSTSFSGESGSSSPPSLKRPWCSPPGRLLGDAAREVGLQLLLGRVAAAGRSPSRSPRRRLLGPGGMLVLGASRRRCRRSSSVRRRQVVPMGYPAASPIRR